MVEFEADDALATAAIRFQEEKAVEQVVICSPDKDLAQLVSGDRVVSWDRRREIVYDEVGVIEKYGVPPASIPDYLALVGDSADGIPGIPAWGAKSASRLLSKFGRDQAMLYRQLTTLRLDVPLKEKAADLEWRGAHGRLRKLSVELGSKTLLDQVPRWSDDL
jgi:5'-3' exonuclease